MDAGESPGIPPSGSPERAGKVTAGASPGVSSPSANPVRKGCPPSPAPSLFLKTGTSGGRKGGISSHHEWSGEAPFPPAGKRKIRREREGRVCLLHGGPSIPICLSPLQESAIPCIPRSYRAAGKAGIGPVSRRYRGLESHQRKYTFIDMDDLLLTQPGDPHSSCV
jgi:hypothetical protein